MLQSRPHRIAALILLWVRVPSINKTALEMSLRKQEGVMKSLLIKKLQPPGFLHLYHHVSKYLVLLLSFKTAVACSIQACFSSQVYIFLPLKMHIKFFSLLAVSLELLTTSTANPTLRPATRAALKKCYGINISILGYQLTYLQTSLMCCQGYVAAPGEGVVVTTDEGAVVVTTTPAGEGIVCTFFFPCLL